MKDHLERIDSFKRELERQNAEFQRAAHSLAAAADVTIQVSPETLQAIGGPAEMATPPINLPTINNRV